MKHMIKQLSRLLLLLLVVACTPQEMDDYGLEGMTTITSDQISFTQTPSTTSDNVITFTNTTPISGLYTLVWNLGNGSSGKNNAVTAAYPFAGDYTVTLTIYTPDGTSASKSVVVNVADDDYSLVDTPVYRNLTGGPDDADGKTWVFDQYNNFTEEVKAATGKDIRGHLGLSPLGSYSQEWWGAGANEKSNWSMYAIKFTFIQNGVQLLIETEGEGYGRNASAGSVGGFNVTSVDGDDATFPFDGGAYNFSIDEGGEYPSITLSGNAFMGYYCGSQTYEIFYQTEEVMALRVANTVESQDWVFIYCLEELNVEPPAVVKVPKAIPLAEGFEGDAFLNFVQEDMGDVSGVVDNPLPLPINTSDKVYRYWKSGGFYSNLSFTAADYKFDLTAQNKLRVKVFIPSFNDYVTEYAVAGDWIANKKLLPQLAVKLQNSDMGGNAWQTQTEIVKADLEMNKWLELEFDFSGVADRTDYDKIVIQFGAEGHAGPGFFFFDDFSFAE